MKISKLFHWLYAVLMFLPLVMFLPSCLYYSLNKYATNETTTTINYKYQSNEVNTLDDLVEGNIYSFNIENLGIDEFLDESTDITFKLLNDLNFYGQLVIDDQTEAFIKFTPETYLTLSYDTQGLFIYTYFSEYQYTNQDYTNAYQFGNYFTNNCYIQYLSSSYSNIYQYLSYTDYNVIESVDTNVQDTISNKMYQAWESIWNLPLFAWTKNSFVSAPFTYITGLFGLSATNSLNYVFAYFCTISICWLVFDLIMYVPNLAHKWIDKGAVE